MNLRMATKERIEEINREALKKQSEEHYRLFHQWEDVRAKRMLDAFVIGAIAGALAVIGAYIIVNV